MQSPIRPDTRLKFPSRACVRLHSEPSEPQAGSTSHSSLLPNAATASWVRRARRRPVARRRTPK
jgi:hypothetical protein